MHFLRVLGGGLSVAVLLISSVTWAEQIKTSPNDDRQYQYLTLSNQLRVLLISDASADKAAASLDVNVGSADDPRDRGGLAHFLEHMLFLGTEKYPEPDEYQSFISAHGGSHNAYTSSEHTNYFFDVEYSHLDKALDRFAQFFVAPLFTPQYVGRERNAVHSEYKSKIKNPYRRELDVYRQLVSPRHPASKFSVGSLETLADREDDLVRDALLEFYQDYYSASSMTLVVLGREPLDELRSMVESRFEQIPLRETKGLVSGHNLFRTNFLPARVQVLPEKEERRLSMVFPVPSAERYYQQKPLEYIGSLLGHEGKGSLLSLLKELGWAEGLSAGGGMSGRNQGTFNISIRLTPEGFENQAKVVAATFRMIQKIRDEGIEPWRFTEQQSLSDTAFRFAEKGEAMGVVSRLSNQMHRYPIEDVIRGGYAFDEFDPRLIRRYLKHLKPDNFLWIVTAPEAFVDKRTELYDTPYSLDRLRYEVAAMPKADLDKLHLPDKNNFIPKRLQVKALPAMEEISPIPQLIKSSDAVEVWFKHDSQYQVPRASIKIRAYSPQVGRDARHSAMAHLYAALVNDALNEFAYPAALAGLHFDVSANSRGIDLELSGYNDRQGFLLSRMLNVMDRSRFAADRFASLQKELSRNWRNQKTLTPYEQLMRKIPVALYAPLWDELAMAEALESVSMQDLRRFSESLWQGSRVQVLLFGNLYRQEALKLATLIEHNLHAQPEDESQAVIGQARIVHLESGAVRYHLQVDHSDVAVAFYQQALGVSVEDQAHMMMIRQMLRSPFFHQLRTEQQLGYIVFVGNMSLKDVAGNAFVVQSPSAPLAQVVESIRAFVVEQTGSTEGFEDHQKALLAGLQQTPKNLNEQSNRYWSEIVADAPDFDRRQQLIKAVEALTPASVEKYSHSALGASRGIWFSASAEAPDDKAVSDLDSFKRDQAFYTFP